MRILFVMRHAMYVRNYESTIRLLAARGHNIHIGFNIEISGRNFDEYTLPRELAATYPGLTFGILPRRNDRWARLLEQTRSIRNYLGYLHPRYQNAPKLVERAERRLAARAKILKHISLARAGWGRSLLSEALRLVELAAPADPVIDRTIHSFQPDVILFTPLVDAESDQVNYLRSARGGGLRTALCVASWDNLTNKGLFQIDPDRVIVWNEIQKREAIEIHGTQPDRVDVTGAQLFDHWFEQKASTTREEFCGRIGLDPRRPVLLYLCSSGFIAGNEVDFVDRWLGRLRASSHPLLSAAGVLVRPHPTNVAQWRDADFSRHDNVAIWPRGGELAIDPATKANYFDSLHHSAAVIGINTTALIEAGIVSRRCFTILHEDFANTQGGTLHFRYLIQGGILTAASTFDEHFAQLEEELRRGPRAHKAHEATRRFLASFVRPHGLDKPATPCVIEAIEKLERAECRPPLDTPRWLLPLRWLIWPVTDVANRRAQRKKQKSSKQPKTPATKNPGRPGALPRVCLGMPLFNQTTHLRQAIRSLLDQTYGDFRLVIVDDSTIDEPGEIVRELARSDSRIEYYRNDKRLGLIANWREVFKRAGGHTEFFAWAGDHDLWHPQWLEKMVEALESDPRAAVAYPLAVHIDDDGRGIDYRPPRFDTCGLSLPSRIWAICTRKPRFGNLVYGLFRASAIRRAGIFRPAIGPDTLLLAEISLSGCHKQVPEELWYRRQSGADEPIRQRQKRTLFVRRPWYFPLPWMMVGSVILAWHTVIRSSGGGLQRRLHGLLLALCFPLNTWYRKYLRLRKRFARIRLPRKIYTTIVRLRPVRRLARIGLLRKIHMRIMRKTDKAAIDQNGEPPVAEDRQKMSHPHGSDTKSLSGPSVLAGQSPPRRKDAA